MIDMNIDLDFESNSLVSIEHYLNTLQSLNEDIVLSSREECKNALETVVQVFSYALEVYKGFLLRNSKSVDGKQDLDSFSSITVHFVESLKILNDSFFTSLTGRYPISRILERVAIESLIRGVFYYGCSINDVFNCIRSKNRNWIKFMKVVQRTKKNHSSSSPLELEDYVSDELRDSNVLHAGLKQMLSQLHDWNLVLQEFEDINEFFQVFNIAYKNLSGFIHSALDTTYTYIEKTTQNEIRAFWGAQFSRECLEKEIQEIIMCVDFLLTLVLSSLSPDIINREGVEHLISIQDSYTTLQETLVLSYPATQLILSHSSK